MIIFDDFLDSHEETIFLMKNKFAKRVKNNSDIDYTSIQVYHRINYIYELIDVALNYRSGLISDTLLRNKPEIMNKVIDELVKILKDSLKDCSGLFYSDPRHCADEYLKKRCNSVFKKYEIENDFV